MHTYRFTHGQKVRLSQPIRPDIQRVLDTFKWDPNMPCVVIRLDDDEHRLTIITESEAAKLADLDDDTLETATLVELELSYSHVEPIFSRNLLN